MHRAYRRYLKTVCRLITQRILLGGLRPYVASFGTAFSLVLILLSSNVTAQHAGVYRKLNVADDTFTRLDSLSYSRTLFDKLSVSINNQFSSKTVDQKKAEDNRTNQQQISRMKINYNIMKDLNMGGNINVSKNFDNKYSNSNASYNIHSNYNPSSKLRFSQSLGPITSERFDTTDTGLRYSGNIKGEYPLKTNSKLVYTAGAAGDNLIWASNNLNFSLNYGMDLPNNNSIKMAYSQNLGLNTYLQQLGEKKTPYERKKRQQRVNLNTNYQLNPKTNVKLSGIFSRDQMETDNIALTQSIDYLTDQFKLQSSLNNRSFSLFDFNNSVAYSIQSKEFKNSVRNEENKKVSVRSDIYLKKGILDSLRIANTFEISSKFDEFDHSDDKDDRTIFVSLDYPMHYGSAVQSKLRGSVSLIDVVFMHKNRSINSKRNKVFKLNPELSYAVAKGFTFKQSYLLSARYIENLIEDIFDTNYINLTDEVHRELSLKNIITYTIDPQSHMSLRYSVGNKNSGDFEGGIFQRIFLKDLSQDKLTQSIAVTYGTRLFDKIQMSPRLSYDLINETDHGANPDILAKNILVSIQFTYTIVKKIDVTLFFMHKERKRNITRKDGKTSSFFSKDNYLTISMHASVF